VIKTLAEFKKPSYRFCVDKVEDGFLEYISAEDCDTN
jgi:hypothetical protein